MPKWGEGKLEGTDLLGLLGLLGLVSTRQRLSSKAIKSKGLTKLSKDFFFKANQSYRLVFTEVTLIVTGGWPGHLSIKSVSDGSISNYQVPTESVVAERWERAILLATSRPSGNPLIEPQDQAFASIEQKSDQLTQWASAICYHSLVLGQPHLTGREKHVIDHPSKTSPSYS